MHALPGVRQRKRDERHDRSPCGGKGCKGNSRGHGEKKRDPCDGVGDDPDELDEGHRAEGDATEHQALAIQPCSPETEHGGEEREQYHDHRELEHGELGDCLTDAGRTASEQPGPKQTVHREADENRNYEPA